MLAVGLAIGAAGATFLAFPPAMFRAQAIVAITDPGSPLAIFLPRNAADVAVSKPVIQRAAESLIGTGWQAPEPDLFERLALAVSVGSTRATGKTARLAADLSHQITAQPGTMPGSLVISAHADQADQSAQIAAAVGEALVAEQDDAILKARRGREAEVSARVERLKSEASAARKRLFALGGVEADPAQQRAGAAAQTATAQARVDAIHAILASGNPPLSDRRDVPSGIEALQTSYLDLSRQLAKARETLGDRNPTIVSLLASVKHAGANLTAEWRRLGKLAEGELAAARDREAKLRKADSPADANRRAALEEARRSVQAADDAVARAQAGTDGASADDRPYRLLSRPAVPNATAGVSLLVRLLLASLAGTLAFAAARLFARARANGMFRRLAIGTGRPLLDADTAITQPADKSELPSPAPMGQVRSKPTRRREPQADVDEDLMHALFELLPELEAIDPAFGAVPTVMVAANEAGLNTTHAAFALGRAVAEDGHRVLLVEADRTHPELAAHASENEEPVLVDLYGALRVALRAESASGLLYLAPSLKHGARIASALARGTETPILDEIGAEFDLVIIDGGQAASCAEAGWGADAYLRVARFDSRRDEMQFAETFDVPAEMILATVVASSVRKAKVQPTVKSTAFRRDRTPGGDEHELSRARRCATSRGRPPRDRPSLKGRGFLPNLSS